MKKTKVIAFANNKGGSGKSTTCANVGYSLSLPNKRTLLIDGDMQLNLSLSFFSEDEVFEAAKGEKNLFCAVKNENDLSDCVINTKYENLDLVPSSTLMSSIEYELFPKANREKILEKCLEKLKNSGKYDYILIDSPPTLGGWAANILSAADYLIIPVEASPWGLFGLANMFEFVEKIKQNSPRLQLLGVAVTKADARKNYLKQTLSTLSETDGINLFETVIRTDSAVEWAQDNSCPVAAFKPSSRAAKEYMKLTEEVIRNVNR